jgi:hypothetical protein
LGVRTLVDVVSIGCDERSEIAKTPFL